MRIRLFLTMVWLTLNGRAVAQSDSLSGPARHASTYRLELIGLGASANRTPFWLSANQFGVVPRTSPAGLITVGTTGRFGRLDKRPGRYVTYGLDVVAVAGRSSGVLLPQAYVSLHGGPFSLWGGRKKERIGLGDTTLTSGFYAWSGNALPITKIQVGTTDFTSLGFTRNAISVHAFYGHGWFANTDSIQQSYLHQKALYVRIGRPDWPVRLTGGVLHNAQWGGHSASLPANVARDGQLPSSFRDYLYVVTARQPDERESVTHTAFDGVNRFGNHLGVIDLSLETTLGRWRALGYHQHPFEDKSGVAFVNFPDGLYGLRLLRQPAEGAGFRVQHLLLEYLNTMSQGGWLTHTGSRYDGQDDYFNNYQYRDGWVQGGRVIGTPFLSRRADLRPERQNEPVRRPWAIANNRVQMTHVAAAGTVRLTRRGEPVRWQTRLSISRNYGTHRSPFVRSVAQVSGAVGLTWPLRWLGGSELQTAVAADGGQLYANAMGGWLSIRKTWKTQR